MRRAINTLRPWQKTVIVSSFDVSMTIICFYFSLAIRYSDLYPSIVQNRQFIFIIFLTTIAQASCFYVSGLYKGIWRFSSLPDLIRVIKGATFAVVCSFSSIFLYNRMEGMPRSVYLIDWLLLVVTLGGGRFCYRLLREHSSKKRGAKDGSRIIIFGAGAGGEGLFREIIHNPNLGLHVIGFVDDDPGKRKKLLHGVPILGDIHSLKSLIEQHHIEKIFIAIPSATGPQIRRIVDACRDANVEIKTLPGMKDIISGKTELSQLRNLEPEDLLGRQEVTLDTQTVSAMVTGERILITGAGGSIGSELCHQIAKFNPKQLILFELTEFFLYTIEMQLKSDFPNLDYVPIIGDIRNKQCFENVVKKYQPKVIFHAAAYKHVPMMECNPFEAIHTNIIGTKIVAETAAENRVTRFVMISTDKAVNPTNIMGATKRIAEIIVQHTMKQAIHTKFMTVRFGNVLGSSGSVIPLFKKQIQNGGPITVTHPEIRRYFMSISEACRLVMQAASIGEGGEIFVLDMGEPIKILDLAKQMISLSGLQEDIDIKIKITGLRPGEKLFEELLASDENTVPTLHPLVRVAKAKEVSENISDRIQNLIILPRTSPVSLFREFMKTIVPEYDPQNIDFKGTGSFENKDQNLH